MACLTTGSLPRRADNPPAAHPVATGISVSVTADIARRLAPENAPAGSTADGKLWSGWQ